MNLLLLFTLTLVCLQYSSSSAGKSGDSIPDTAPPGFHHAFDPKTRQYFLVVDDSSSTTEKTDADKDQDKEKTKTDKDHQSDTKPDATKPHTAFGKLPAVPQGFRQAFDPRTRRFFLVVDPTAEKDAENDLTNVRAKVSNTMSDDDILNRDENTIETTVKCQLSNFGADLTPSVAVLDQLPKGFRQVYDPLAGRFVLVLDSTTEKNDEKDQKKDGSGSLIPHEVTALLSGGGLVTLLKGLQMLCERMGWFKKTQEVAAAIAPAAATATADAATTAAATAVTTAAATATATAAATVNPAPKSVLVELAEIMSSPSSTSTKS